MQTTTCCAEQCVCNPRILVVDNDPDDCTDHVKCLRDWGFRHVYIASGKGHKLLQNAVYQATQNRCHLALVDMRLLDNHDAQDESGLQLLSALRPTRTILVTAYGTMGIGVQALQEYGATDAVGKQDGPAELKRAVHKALDNVCGRRFTIQWPADWSAKRVASELTTSEQSVDADEVNEVNDLFVQLFPDAEFVRLEHVNGANGTPMKRPGRRQSIVFVAYVDNRTPVIVKIAFAERVQSEVQSYKKYVDQRIQHFKVPHLRHHAALWQLGGLAYTLIGGAKVTSYTKRYREVTDVEDAIRPLREHFYTTWSENYGWGEDGRGAPQTVQPGSLLDVYYEAWKEELQVTQGALSLENLLEQWQHEERELSMAHTDSLCILNPYGWIAENQDAAYFPHLKQAIIHGDLHGNNVLVDSDNHPWIIDFDRTRNGYLLFDMTEIMQYLFTRIADLPVESPAFYELAVALADFMQPTLRLSRNIADNREAYKAHQVLDALRTMADDLEMYTDPLEMLWGLLIEAVFISLIIPHDRERVQKMRLLAGILCQRLAHWPTPNWIPSHWPAIEWLDT